MAEFHNPNQINSGRTQINYNYRKIEPIDSGGYGGVKDEDDNIDQIIAIVLDELKKDGIFDNVIIDEDKIANNVVQYLIDNDLLEVDTNAIISDVKNQIKNDATFIASLKGDKGDPGKDGAPGPKGDPGVDGKDGISPSASDVATELKSDTTFVASIKGEPGANGIDGQPGPKGDPGQDGNDGQDGAPGPKGDPGADGKDADPQDVADILKADTDFLISVKGDKGDPGKDGTAADVEVSAEDGNLLEKKDDGLYVGSDYDNTVSKLKDDGYITDTKVPTKEEIIDNLVNTLDSTGYLIYNATNEDILRSSIAKLIDDAEINGTVDDGSDPPTYTSFTDDLIQQVIAEIGTSANYDVALNQLISDLVKDGLYVNSPVDTAAQYTNLVDYLKSIYLIEYNDPAKKQQVKDHLMNSTIFDDLSENHDTLISIAIQSLKDAGLLGDKVNIGEITSDVMDDLKSSGFLNGYAKESYVDTEVQNLYKKTVQDLEDHTEAMKDQIRKGYQNILDEAIRYFVYEHKTINQSLGPILTFSVAPLTNNGFVVDADGYVELKKDRLYYIHPSIMINSGSNKDVGYSIIKKNGENIIDVYYWSEDNGYSDFLMPIIIKPTEDCAVAIQMSRKAVLYAYGIAIYEIKQPVMTNVNVASYADQVGHGEDTPVGQIISFMGNTAPENYLACDGAVHDIADYPDLADFFNTQFGSINHFGGDGITTFAVPDLRGEFLRGTGQNSHAGNGNGADVGIHQDATRQNYFGVLEDGNRQITNAAVGYTNSNNANDLTQTTMDSSTAPYTGTVLWQHRSSNNTMKSISTFTARPTNTSIMWCIKAFRTFSMKFEDAKIYSEDERVVGKWIDSKVLYQKTVVVQNFLNAAGMHEYQINIPNIEFGFLQSAFSRSVTTDGKNNFFTVDHASLLKDYINAINVNPETIVVSAQQQLSQNGYIHTGYLTIRYTKK